MQNNKDTINGKRYRRYIDLAYQYHIAAISIWASVVETPYLFNPCMFLARHTVELLLKGLIYRDCENASSIKTGAGNRQRKVDNTHDLLLLWQSYLKNKQPSIFPTPEESKRITTVIKSITKKDDDSTKYRYPETKPAGSLLNLEPIAFDNSSTIALNKLRRPPLVIISPDGPHAIKSGTNSFKQGYDIFDLIEALFQLAE